MNNSKAIIKILSYTFVPFGRFELVTATDRRWIRRSFRRPNRVRKLLILA